MKHWLTAGYLFPLILTAQENFGAAFSNYTPTNSVFLNPSSISDAKTWLDIHIVGAGAYGMNNLAYINNDNYLHILRTRGEELRQSDLLYNHSRNKYHAYSNAFARVLSGVWCQGDHAAGLFFNVRSIAAVRGIPDYAARFIQYGVPPYTQQHQIDYDLKKVRAAAIGFGEIQLSYSYTFYKKQRDMLMAGISLKKMISLGGGAVNLYDFGFNVRSDTLVSVFNLQTDAMYTPEVKMDFKGGLGLDLGITYQRMLSECASYYPNSPKMGCRSLSYKYKIGFSILDVGSVKFREENFKFAGYDFQSYDWYNYSNTDPDQNDALSVFQNQESDITTGRVKKPRKIRLPTCVSLQGDYNLWASRLYANASIVQGLPVGKNKFGVRRANSLMVGLRYETRFLDVSLPFSLYEYRYPQLGLAVRIYCLTIGTDKFLSGLVNSDLYGGDIYIHLKIPVYYHPKCRSHHKAGLGYDPSRIRRKKHDCDAYY